MAEEPQPKTVQEGATTGDVEEDVQATAKSAEDRKAAAALASLDARGGDDSGAAAVDQEAVSKAMKNLGGATGGDKKEVKKVKVEAADVTLLVSLFESILPYPFFFLVGMNRAKRHRRSDCNPAALRDEEQ